MTPKDQYKSKIIITLKILYVFGVIVLGPLAIFTIIDLVENPLISVIIGALLLMCVTILAGLGKATGETFGANKLSLVLKSLFKIKTNKNK